MERSVAKIELEAQVFLIIHTDYVGYSSAILTNHSAGSVRHRGKTKRGSNVFKSKSLGVC